ncbi:hypothetical protein IGI04_006922, partial [Brassica rapa subsp. trilocularis]
MAQDDAAFGAPGEEPTPTPAAAPPITSDFMSSVMARLARQDEVQKTTNDQLAALVAALTAPEGQTSRPQQIRRRLFNTNPTETGVDHISDDSEPNETLLADALPAGSDLTTIRELAELKLSLQQMGEKIYQSVLAATSRTPFTRALTSVQLGKIEKLRLPEYKPGGDPKKDQSLREYMEKFKAVVSKIEIPNGIAIDALHNTLWVHSKFRGDLYHNPTKSLQDAIARSDNFIRMEEDTNAILSKMSAPKAPAAKNANTRQEPRQHAPNDKNGRKDGYMYVVNENNVPISTLVVRGEGWNKWARELESPDQKVDTDNGEGDSSADEEHPANRRRIEVILSQQSLSSDEDNDDSPVPGDLRDILKRKFEPENEGDTTRRDLRTMLDARKSRRISTSDGNNNEGPISDLRDKLNAGACDLRVKLNRSKPTDLRRQLERVKGQPQLPPPDTS